MTAQTPDTVIYNNETYDLIGAEASGLIHPSQFGISAEKYSTACYRGYYCAYEIKNEVIYLQKLFVHAPNNNYPSINGIAATRQVNDPKIIYFTMKDGELVREDPADLPESSERFYCDLNFPIQCTGKLRIARDFIGELYVHMGFQKASAYREVIDLSLFRGKVAAARDRSSDMKAKRGQFRRYYEKGDFRKTIRDAFRSDLDIE